MWTHREHLLKVARRRSMSLEDAEDAVHEAMLRAMENPRLDHDRLAAWLTTVTIRLCVDRYRQVNREAEVGSRTTYAAPVPAPVEDMVCDRDEASWLAQRSGELPGRQAEALWLKSEDLDVGQVARRMGLSYRTVESLLARARRTLRNSLAGTLVVTLWLCGRGRPRSGGAMQAAAVVSTAATLTVLGIAAPGVFDGTGPAPSGPSAERPQERRTTAYERQPPEGAVRGPLRRDAPPGARGTDRVVLPVALPALPSLSGLRVTGEQDVAEIPPLARLLGLVGGSSARSVPTSSLSGLPELPDVVGETKGTDLPDATLPATPTPSGLPEPAVPPAPSAEGRDDDARGDGGTDPSDGTRAPGDADDVTDPVTGGPTLPDGSSGSGDVSGTSGSLLP